ncbi:MAG: nodulation protein NfeD [Geobacteraceae bacterium]|nr:nodulation protein NfeD [Geobacteraceae bacterium]
MLRALTVTILLLTLACPGLAETPVIRVLAVDGPINPVTVDYLRKNLHESARKQESLVLIEMDTPGGLDTAMREIVKEVMASPVPVAVFVTPAGARAASAGAVIGLAADILAMSPGTNIGAAHPVSIGEKPDKVMQDKVLNDAEAYAEGIARKRGRNAEVARTMVRASVSLAAEKALEERVIDLMASNRAELLKKLDGLTLRRDGRDVTLQLAGAETVAAGMSSRQRILNAVSNPNVAYVLLMLGLLGLFFELSNPGVILPGVIGGISLILAFFAFQTLPVNYAGVLLIIFALILFIAEIKIVSHGMLAVGGVISLIFGSLLLFESPEPYLRVSWGVILPTVLATTLFILIAVTKAVQVHRLRPVTGREGLVGETGTAESELAPEGKVFVRGEYWDAIGDERIAQGEKVVVAALEGMRLRVKKAGTGD